MCSLGQRFEPVYFTLPPSKYRRLHAFWKVGQPPLVEKRN